MNTTISEIATRMAELEQQLERALTDEIEEKRRTLLYAIEKRKIAFESVLANLKVLAEK